MVSSLSVESVCERAVMSPRLVVVSSVSVSPSLAFYNKLHEEMQAVLKVKDPSSDIRSSRWSASRTITVRGGSELVLSFSPKGYNLSESDGVCLQGSGMIQPSCLLTDKKQNTMHSFYFLYLHQS